MYWHHKRHGVFNLTQASLTFFLGLNAIVCIWEICLFLQIDLIEKKHASYKAEFKGRAIDIAIKFFMLDVYPANVFSSKLWAEVHQSPSIPYRAMPICLICLLRLVYK